MKKVVHYISGVYLPVTETWIYGQIVNLKKYQPLVYAYKTENLDIYPSRSIKIRSLELKPGVVVNPVLFFNKAWHKVFKFYPYFAFCMLKDRPHIVHAHFGTSGYAFLKLKRLFKLPLITTFYGVDMSALPEQNPEWRKMYQELFHEGELFLVEGNHMRKRLIELGCPSDKVMVQHLGIDLDKIKFVPRKAEGEIKILISGSFREKKGIPYAVEAFGKVKRRHPELPLKLTIIGDSPGGKPNREKEKILEAIRKYKLEGHVNMLGYQPYPVFIKELYRHHIFLHPSVHASDGDTEGGAPVSIIEASASGMPVLSTTHCDIPEVVKDGVTGFLVPERDSDALADRLEELILNPELWVEMGKKARKHVEENYDVKRQVKRLEEIYDMVLARVR